MNTSDTITPSVVAEHGLTPAEYQRILEILGRAPNLTELGIFSVMWSEHCSYKSSKIWLKRLPTQGPYVICGPGENAGVVDIGDGMAVIFKIESHNHPSYIEPYQGAATGVGGILRDVFTMGARPIANLNALRFGDPNHPKTRHLVAGVVAGIGGYGNCVGVPTVGGETNFDPAYNGNCLVNCMTVGLARTDRIFYSRAAGPGNPMVYLGAKTGRDGIHGATMASAEFDEKSAEKRPTVQVGDPFTEKLLIEACLELMATDAIVAIQDMGAAGLTSSSVEMAGKGGLGIELDLDRVPMRETGMTAYEIMLSESQERMLMVLRPGREDIARRIFEKYELDFAIIGHLTTTGNLTLRRNGQTVADMPIAPMVSAAPEYDRPLLHTPRRPVLRAADVPAIEPRAALLRLMGSPDLCSRRWIWEQYDHLVRGHTVQRPGGDAAVVRIPGGRRALALTVDCTPRYCHADPEIGGAQAVVETWRNLNAVGAEPLAITDNMNFGNPERPEIMGQFAGCIEGMARACAALAYPVVSGNVSLYNETNGQAVLPAPVIGGVGLIDDLTRTVDIALKRPGEAIMLIGHTTGWLGGSLYVRNLCADGLAKTVWAPPPIDLDGERAAGELVRALIRQGLVSACHDVSDGGLLVTLAEMALAGNLGANLEIGPDLPPHASLFGEDQGRYVLTAAASGPIEAASRAAAVPLTIIGRTLAEGALTLNGRDLISLDELRTAHEAWLPRFMAGEPTARA
jgi:phosphoribosylformylglycinamidine synthase subunit PurL